MGDKSMSIGRLVGAEWSVGATTSHSLVKCQPEGATVAPFVKLELTTDSVSAGVVRTPLTLTLAEFRELHAQLKDVARAMEGV